jgi:hypothetical protein
MIHSRSIALLLLASGCATQAAPPRDPGAPVAAAPARLVGPDGRMQIVDGVLTGELEGGRYQARVGDDGAAGKGPLGVIDLRVEEVGNELRVDGLWNGAPVSFVVGKDVIRGTAMRAGSTEERGLASCRYDINGLWRRATYAGHEDCGGLDRPVRFDYHPPTAAGLADDRTAILVVAYLLAPLTL